MEKSGRLNYEKSGQNKTLVPNKFFGDDMRENHDKQSWLFNKFEQHN